MGGETLKVFARGYDGNYPIVECFHLNNLSWCIENVLIQNSFHGKFVKKFYFSFSFSLHTINYFLPLICISMMEQSWCYTAEYLTVFFLWFIRPGYFTLKLIVLRIELILVWYDVRAIVENLVTPVRFVWKCSGSMISKSEDFGYNRLTLAFFLSIVFSCHNLKPHECSILRINFECLTTWIRIVEASPVDWRLVQWSFVPSPRFLFYSLNNSHEYNKRKIDLKLTQAQLQPPQLIWIVALTVVCLSFAEISLVSPFRSAKALVQTRAVQVAPGLFFYDMPISGTIVYYVETGLIAVIT